MKGSLVEGGARLCSACLHGYEATPKQQALSTLKPVVLIAVLQSLTGIVCSFQYPCLKEKHAVLVVVFLPKKTPHRYCC